MRVCVGRRLARVTPETRATGTVDWLCYSCLRAGTKVPAVTLRQGTALCETCALGEGQSLTLPAEDLTLALIDGETGRVVYAPTPDRGLPSPSPRRTPMRECALVSTVSWASRDGAAPPGVRDTQREVSAEPWTPWR